MDQNQFEKQKEEQQQRLMMIIEKIERQLDDFSFQNQDNVIMLIGKTGCGKSTIYNFLCGAQFQLCEDEYGSRNLELLSKSDKYQEIKGGLDSTTKTPKIYYDQEYEHSIIDYPGFNDTEGKDQLEIQLFFNKIVSLSKMKIVYVLLNPGDQFQNKAEDLQNFINEADIDLSKLTVIINSYSKKRTDEQLIADFQSQLINKFKKQAHQLIVQRDIDETEKIEKYLSNEYRKKMWMELINSKVISMKPYDLNIYKDVNNFIDNASQELSDSLFQILKDIQYKQYQTQKIQEVYENIKKLENFNLILQRFIEGDVYMLYQIMMFVGTFNENYIKAISKIYSFFLEYKMQLDGYQKMQNSLLKANQNLKICLDYLQLNQKYLEQLKQVEEKKNLLEDEKQMMKIEKSKMEDRIRIKEDELNNLKELLQKTQVNFKYEMENQIKLIQDQTLLETTSIINDKIKIEQEMSKIQVQHTDLQNKFTQLQNDKNNIVTEFEKMKNQYNQDLINFKVIEQKIQSQNKQANNQIMDLQQKVIQLKIKNKQITEHSQYLQIENKGTNDKLLKSQQEKTEIEKQLNNNINQLTKKDLDYQKVFDQLNELKAKYKIEEQRKQLLEQQISKLMKSQDENNNIEQQNNINEIQNQFIQASQQYQTTFIPQQQQLQNQNKSQKDEKNHSEKNQEKPVVVLIGMTGSGRTTLFNKICNTQENVGEGRRSITKQSILGKSVYSNEFYIIDTPGLGTQQKKINHAVGIWNAMQEKPLNKIIIILKFELLQLMVKQLIKQIIILRRYRKIIIVAVTHFDQCKQQQIDQQNIQNEMKKFGIQNVLFFQQSDSGQSICNQINQYLMNSIPIQVEITQGEFLNYFDLLDEPELEEDVFQLMEEISNISTKLRKMISNKFKFSQQLFEQSVDADDIYFKVQNEIKIYTQLLIQERKQIIQQLNKISNNQQYQETFNIDWFDSVEKLVEYLIQQDWYLEIKQLNQQALSYLSKNQASIINSLKVCQNCCLVWYCQFNSNNMHFCGISVQDEDKSLFDDQFWTTIQLFNTKNDISTLEYQNEQQYIKEYIKKRNNQNINHGCGKQLDLLSINQNCFEYFYLSLDLFNQSSQYYLEQNKYIELLNLIQKVKQNEPVKYLQF